MSYRVNRAIGFQPWGVTNPWVFANYGQPQRRRGYVSPLVYTTQPPYLRSEHLAPRWPYFPSSQLGQVAPEPVTPAEARARRMEIFSMVGLGLSATSLFLFWRHVVNRARAARSVRSNRKRRSRSRRGR